VGFLAERGMVRILGIARIFPPVVGIGPLGGVRLANGGVQRVVRVAILGDVGGIASRGLRKAGWRLVL
jgi:hypothetical protein